jgi:hypothetical protein
MAFNAFVAFKIFGPLLVWQQIIDLFVIAAILSEILQITEVVKTINVTSWHFLNCQVLNSGFGIIPNLPGLKFKALKADMSREKRTYSNPILRPSTLPRQFTAWQINVQHNTF